MIRKIVLILALITAWQISCTDPVLPRILDGRLGPKWPHESSDLKPETGIIFGSLPNGMRYAIRKNATPPGQTSIRFRIAAGAFDENENQQGLAHLIEHMAFKGSKRVPEGEMLKILQRKGLAFGPDTNASTSLTQTAYQLDLPKSDSDTVDTALMLMRETASELLLNPEALERERKVVLSEERVRDTPDFRTMVAYRGSIYEGQLASRRMPIGKADVIRNAPPSLIKEFYTSYYRPERATLIVVGDIDPLAIEMKIKSLFSDWTAPSLALSEPDLGSVKQRGLTAKVIEQPGTNTFTYLSWVKPYDETSDSRRLRISDLVEYIGLAVLDRRLQKISRSDHPPFVSADSSLGNSLHSAKLITIWANSAPENWKTALAAIENEQRRLVTYGVTKEEIELEISNVMKTRQDAVATAATRQTIALADWLLNSVDQEFVPVSPADSLAYFEEATKEMTVENVNATLKRLFEGSGPIVQVSSPVPVEGEEAAVLEAFKKAHATPVLQMVADGTPEWPYTNFGTPGTVSEKRMIDDLGIVAVRFSNGVRLTVKPTKFRNDQILIGANIGNGLLELPKDSPIWLSSAFIAGGLKKVTVNDLAKILAPKVVGVNFDIGEDAFAFTGRTNKRDFDLTLQIMAAYLTEPGYRQEAVERQRLAVLNALPQMAATANGVYSRDTSGLMHGGDPRFSMPSQEQIEAGKAEMLEAMLKDPLSHGAIEVTIVGDLDPEDAIRVTAATLGALPPRSEAKPDDSLRVMKFADVGTSIQRAHKGRSDEALAFIAWPTTDSYTEPGLHQAVYVATQLIGNRLLDQVRSAEGATYTPYAGRSMSKVFPNYGYAFAMVETTPRQIANVYASISSIVADIRANGVSVDEFARAKVPVIENLKNQMQTNEWWVAQLMGAERHPQVYQETLDLLPIYQQLTAEDIRKVFTRFFSDEKSWKFVVLPEDPQASANSPVIK